MSDKRKVLFLVLLAIFLLTGCKGREIGDDMTYIYCLNTEENALVKEAFEVESEDQNQILKLLVDELNKEVESSDYKKAIPEKVKIERAMIDNNQLTVEFNGKYTEQDKVREILCKAAVVKTLAQVPGIDSIFFSINGTVIHEKAMTANDFIETTGDSMNSYEEVELILYYANDSGEKLVKVTETTRYQSNVSLARLVVEQLMEGPPGDEGEPVIPEDTKLLSVTVKDGICYVNFDEGYLKQTYDVKEELPVYAVVNSLSELSDVNKVQIAVNGETGIVYRESLSLDTLFERDLDLVKEGSGSSKEEKIPAEKDQEMNVETTEEQEIIKKGE